MATLAHLGVIWPITGLLIAIIIWASQKQESHYVGRHALQAVAWQAALVILWTALLILCVLVSAAVFLLMPIHTEVLGTGQVRVISESPVAWFAVVITIGLIALTYVLMTITGIVAAVWAWKGRTFRYPLVTKIVAGRRQQ